ncbi:UvrD-helicase domain-containing protein, partial [Vibrio sp. 10N.222.49.C9]
SMLKELTEDLLDGDKDLLRQLVSTISNWKNDMLTPAQARASAQGEQHTLFADCFEMYQRQMVAYNALDFDDLILMPVLLLKQNEEVRERWRARIRYLLVDEYQDT